MDTMKAVRIHEYGGPEVLTYEDAPRPAPPGPGDVLIRVHAAAVNPVDWKVRAGYLRAFCDYKLPMVPGWDVSGVVEAAGAGVTRLKKGDAVYANPDLMRDGAYAEYVVVGEDKVALKPKTVDHVQAAAMPITALTAWQSLDASGLSKGQRILIHGAAGGIGSFAVQLAKLRGAYVIGTASGRNQAFLRTLGVDEAIDYEKTKFEDVVRDVDVVLDTVGGLEPRSWKTLKRGGVCASVNVNRPLTAEETEEASRLGVRLVNVYMQPTVKQLDELAQLVDAGKVKPIVETVLPLSDAKRAHEINQTGHTRGKIVLQVV
jgi:NADPH:quinone reductase-like Zn-dependent oxidoreductase